MKTFKNGVLMLLFLMIFWVLIAGVAVQELIIGLIVSILITIFVKSSIFGEVKLSPKAILHWILYSFVFTIELIKSNFDVAFRVLHPVMPINPGIVKVRTKLKSRLGRLLLANSITLTPGTLTVEVKDEFFYIHWIDVTSDDIEGATQAIVHKFEKYLEVVCG